ncbi:D-alanyl-D-alanine carboxypeptidase DacA precursor [mine drainage metagenome]|uniref:serine-type D-Ala-D-Ala carboxypeptidase n=1 Tax=mine drainage metagenome TaxID=410659 RepID=A0A1J5QTF5_9ZZZZ
MSLALFSRVFGALLYLALPGQASALPSLPAVPGAPDVDARNYVLIDPDSGQTLVEREADTQVPPASLTKLMTAYLTFEALTQGKLRLNQPGMISVAAWKAGGSTMFLQPGLPVTVEQMISGMVVVSGNDAAIALAETIAGDTASFVQMMNATAHQLGMTRSHFDNVNGLPTPTHRVSAEDIALLTENIIRQYPQYLHYFAQQSFTYNHVTQRNWNPLIFSDSSVTGMKTGHTDEAGYCLDATATRNGQRLIAVVMGSRTRNDSARAAESLLNYGYRFFDTRHIYHAGQQISTLPDAWANPAQIAIGISREIWVTLPIGHSAQLQYSLNLPAQLPLPLAKGQIVGSLILSDAGREIRRIPLVALQSVEKTNWLRHLWNVSRAFF